MDRVYLTKLYDLYNSLLTEKEKDIFSLYYEQDLSYQEIADNLNISRSAVFNSVKSSTDKLSSFEEKIGMNKMKSSLEELLSYNDINIIKNKLENILEQ